ncbi:helix-turn-helix transcriptional regulator [Robiginitalea sp. M366]|uniref:helix-turn-helix domain-containing protein n=1 Tax=Robiginitalea aestuariiviva TaxID=3036903 RepID=UPI00240D3E84|nr:helix-turn-helix transcriptional regulator [Robiginitalea aestuariiviva]MDG1571153.1 helix-turn-helix transcriptional regulator [Robiginitalea aestuariiviva]
MGKICNLETVNDYCERFYTSAKHPLVTTLDLKDLTRRSQEGIEALRFNFYAVFLKQGKHCTIKYGRRNYDYQDGTLVFIGPGQVVTLMNDGNAYIPSGQALLFHPDLLRGTHLGQVMNQYHFFSYEVSEALHLSRKERHIVLDCLDKIDYELEQGVDPHSKKLIVSNLELFLNYCNRFYDRQFITREDVHQGVVEQFSTALEAYLNSKQPQEIGTPTVGYFAGQLNLSANYFGDLIKKETGQSAQEFIQDKIIEVAKEKIFDPEKSVSEVAFELGFKYPQHFTRLFKKKVGATPQAYRATI